MSPRPIICVRCALSQEHNDENIEDILCDAPECFNGVLDMSDGLMGYIFQQEDSTVKFSQMAATDPFIKQNPGVFLLRCV